MIISLQNIIHVLTKILFCPILRSGSKHIYVMLYYFYTCSLYHYFNGILPLTGHVNRELKLSVNQSITLPLLLRYINFPTAQDFSGFCRGVWMVKFCNNEAILVWITEAATFTGRVWLLYSVNVTEIMFDRALRRIQSQTWVPYGGEEEL